MNSRYGKAADCPKQSAFHTNHSVQSSFIFFKIENIVKIFAVDISKLGRKRVSSCRSKACSNHHQQNRLGITGCNVQQGENTSHSGICQHLACVSFAPVLVSEPHRVFIVSLVIGCSCTQHKKHGKHHNPG